eukprot:3368535-Pyramimonas_sp.AAC.1
MLDACQRWALCQPHSGGKKGTNPKTRVVYRALGPSYWAAGGTSPLRPIVNSTTTRIVRFWVMLRVQGVMLRGRVVMLRGRVRLLRGESDWPTQLSKRARSGFQPAGGGRGCLQVPAGADEHT